MGAGRTLAIVVGLLVVITAVVLWRARRHLNPLPPGATADHILVDKTRRRLALMKNGAVLKTYRVSLGGHPIGPKSREGDQRTPEGDYVIDFRKADSSYHRALHVGYPRPDQIAAAKARNESPGGDIMIHGLPNGWGWLGTLHRSRDWTAGCIAVTDAEIEEIWRVVPDGTPVRIIP